MNVNEGRERGSIPYISIVWPGFCIQITSYVGSLSPGDYLEKLHFDLIALSGS